MPSPEPDQLLELRARLLAILTDHGQGISEHALLKQLRSELPGLFPEGMFKDNLALYRAHFLLFHVLHRLRAELLAERRGLLEIDALCIRLRAFRLSEQRLPDAHDPLADYYLDLGRMEDTDADDVEELLGSFWARYYADSQRHQALAVLDLADPVDFDRIKARYRQLAMRHHPDRGGDAGRFQQLQQAMAVLRKCEG